MYLSQVLNIAKYIAIPVFLGGCLLCMVIAVFAYALTPDGLNPGEALVLRAYLLQNNDELNTPLGTDPALERFVVEENDSANAIGIRLVTNGIISNGSLFARYVRYEGLDTQLRAGTFFVSDSMTIPQIAIELTNPLPTTVRLVVIEGWRMEQIAAVIDAQPLLDFTGDDFLAIVGQGAPIPIEFQTQNNIPPGSSLEGFLFPATYEVPLTSTAVELRDQMLDAFNRNITQTMIRDAVAGGSTIFDVVTVAAIVEREAVLPIERPTIASVYLNRLAIGQKLDADPTTQYGIGNTRDGNWWTPLTVADYQLNHPYNTYVNTGLPPGPIANPSVSSIRAVIYPANTPYFYFQADCSGNGSHVFAVSYEEHLGNLCQ